MKGLFKFFGSLSGSLPSKVLTSLGMGFVSMAGFGVLVNNMVDTAVSNWNNVSGVILQVATISGFTTGFGIILGAIIARAALTGLTSLGKITQ